MTGDSFQNFAARLGIGADNMSSAASYGFNPITRNRQLLEWMYGGSWIVGKCVDAIADDMTTAGITIQSKADPGDVEKLETALNNLAIWPKLTETIKWARLYGGAIAVMLIDGQRLNTPLRPETISAGQFKGLAVLDRWMINPSLSEPITALGPDLGEPKFYDVTVSGGPLPRGRIHHSRVIRIDGIPQPHWRKIAENGWGLSVVEPLYDRLVAFDSTTTGAAQLVFKAHLRTLKIQNLRQLLAAGGKMMEGVAAQVDAIRLYQSSEGLTLLDATDDFQTHSYTFTGLDDLLLQFGQQLSGAMDIPLVRLFGQSPAGLNSTGESDMRAYYDGIKTKQEARLRRPLTTLLNVVHRSELGREPDEGFNFAFTPLWQLSDKEKGETAASVTTAVTTAFETGVIDRPTAMKELRASSQVTGVYSNITDEAIDEAESEPPPGAGELMGEGGDLDPKPDDEAQPKPGAEEGDDDDGSNATKLRAA